MNVKHNDRLRLVLLALACTLSIMALYLVWCYVTQRSVVQGGIPPRPVSSSWSSELEEGVTGAEKAATSYLHAKAGLIALSKLYHANGMYNEAIQCYGGLQRIEPTEPRWWHLQASILAGFGRMDEALPLEARAVDLASSYAPARLRFGDMLLKTNKLTEAEKEYSEVSKRNPGDPYALLGLAKCAIANADWNKGRDFLRESIKQHPDFIGGMSLMATVAEHFGDQSEADSLRAEIGRREFSDHPDPWLDGLIEYCYDPYRLSVASVVTNMAGNAAAARHLLERAIALAPQSGSYHRQLGLLLSQGIDSRAARRHLEQAVALSPSDADSWLLLVQLLTNMGDAPAADQALAKGLANCLDSASLHMERARRWNAAGHPTEAITEFREAYRLNPGEGQALIEMASALFAMNRGAEALAALHEALRKQPEHPMALATLAFYYINAGDKPGALGWWEHVRRQSRTPPQTVASLKQAYREHFGQNPPE